MRTESATLAGGCFWCTEAALKQVRGVLSVTSGYTGGSLPQPSYEQVCTGRTGHAEAVRVTFDPDVLPYPELLRLFFAVHDPTTVDRQGADIGPQYRSAVFHESEEQRRQAEDVIAELTADAVFPAPIVTQVVPFEQFWPAEQYHQDYYAQHPEQGYCRVVIAPKLEKLRRYYADRLQG